ITLYTILFLYTTAQATADALDSLSSVELKEFSVSSRRVNRTMGQSALIGENINRGELIRAACCNLGESFTTNPSVDVSYTDAATGAKQIRLLGLSGTYVQMLAENLPAFRGAAAPFALGYVPGPWMQSIQVSKGSASVKNGSEAITGQINIEYLKPQADEAIHINIYSDTDAKIEANFDGNFHFPHNADSEAGPWSTSVLAHYDNSLKGHDGDHDGFMDKPRIEQFHIANRWARVSDKNIFQAKLDYLTENRRSGQHESGHSGNPLYTIGIRTDRAELFAKDAVIINADNASNLAIMINGSLHKLDARYGNRTYSVDQWNGYASLMYESNIASERHSISAGLSMNYDAYENEALTTENTAVYYPTLPRETTIGAYAQYTFNLDSRLIAMAGFRIDHSSEYGWFATPRAHIKYSPADFTSIRLSVGKGFRTNHVIAENNYLLASSRSIIIAQDIKQEEAWNYGFSTNFNCTLFDRPLTASAEYYYTRFINQLVADFDSNAHTVVFDNLHGRSISHT
ncbi:MAG: TonB-dependent receptor, partial [Muribaculaceae bacterium]|nr:TonB-dependent receptor [Muribaculaceae bacterium]